MTEESLMQEHGNMADMKLFLGEGVYRSAYEADRSRNGLYGKVYSQGI